MILLTGASGFLGGAILNAGRQQISYRTISRSSLATGDHITLDLTGDEIPESAFNGVDTVIHAAGLAHQFGTDADQREKFFRVNATAVANVVEAAKKQGIRHVVLVSSMSVYGPGSADARKETDKVNPQGHYAESKYEGECLAIESAKNSNLKLTILRMATLYGEGDQGNVNRLIQAIDRGRFLLIGDCKNQKNLLYKSDAARSCLFAAANTNAEKISVFNVASEPVTMRRVIENVCVNLGRRIPLRVPGLFVNALRWSASMTGHQGPLGRIYDSVKKFTRSDLMDGTKFEKEFGFAHEVSLEEGLRRQISSYQEKGGR